MATPTRPRATAAQTPSSTPEAAPGAVAEATAPPAVADMGLSTPAQITELADKLSACADQIHERVMKEIRAYEGRAVPEQVQDAARALFEDEVLLRQRANSLYADAAALIVKGLGKPQAHLVKLTADAAEKIRKIGVLGEMTGLVGGLLQLAGAAMTAQPVAIFTALEKVEKHAKAVKTLQPKPPAKTS